MTRYSAHLAAWRAAAKTGALTGPAQRLPGTELATYVMRSSHPPLPPPHLTPLSRRLTSLLGLCVLGLLSCGREITAPERSAFGGRVAALAVEPRFPELPGSVHGASEVEPFVRVRVLLRGTDGGVVLDTMVPFPAAADSITLNLRVPLPAGTPSTGLPLQLLMRYINAAGDTVFAGGPVAVNALPVGTAGGGQVVPILIVPTGVGANAASVAIVPATGTAVAGTTTTFVATARDGQGVAIPGTPVIFSTPDPLAVQMTSLSSGTVTWLQRRGPARVVATLLNGQTATATFTISLPATRLAIVSGNAQSATVSAALALPVVLRVAASDDVPVAGVLVTFAVATGGGALSTLVATSDVAGNVSTNWTLGAFLGAQSITATYPGLVGGPVTVTATALARVATQLVITAAPTTVVAGVAIPAVTVEARDVTGVLAPAFTGPITLTLNAGATGATLVGTATVNAVAGLATFSGLTIQRAATGLTLSASSGALTAGTSAAFAVTPAAAATLAAVSGGGQAALAGSVLPTPFVARVVDAFTNPVAGVTVGWSILSGGGSLSVASTVSDAAGLVSTVLTLPAVAGAVAVQATAAGLAGSPSAFAATALAGVATVLIADPVASGNGQSGVVSTTLAAPLRVRVRDALGNGVAGQSVTWGITGGTGVLSATTVISDGTGLAQTNLTLGSAAGAVTVAATAAGLTGSPVVFTATAQPGVATTATIDLAPTGGTAGALLFPATVTARDAFGNVATGFAGNVVVAINSGPASAALGGTLTRPATAGVATFANLTLDLAGAYVLRFTAGALPAVLAPSFTVVAAAPASITAVAGNAQTATAGSLLPAGLAARVTDAFGNPVAGVTVTWTVTVGGGAAAPATSLTDANGVANSSWTLGGLVGAQMLTATALALTPAAFAATATAPAFVAYNWTGATSTDWYTASNWAENVVPGATDSVFIGAAVVTMPLITVRPTIRALVNLNAAPVTTATDVGLIVTGRVVLRPDTPGLDCVGGSLEMTHPAPGGALAAQGRIQCSFYSQQGTVTLTDSLFVSGSLILIGTSRFILAGRTARSPHLIANDQASFVMTNTADRLITTLASLAGTANTTGLYTAGELHVSNGFYQSEGSHSFVASGTHRTVFTTGIVATSNLSFTAPETSGFAQLDIRWPLRVVTAARVTGDAFLGDGGTIFGQGRLRIAGNLAGVEGASVTVNAIELGGGFSSTGVFSPDTVVFTGTNQLVPFEFATGGRPDFRSIRIAAGATVRARTAASIAHFMSGDLIVEGEFTMDEPGRPATVTVGRDLRVVGNGLLRLGGNFANLIVQRDALFDGRTMAEEMAVGELGVGRNLTQLATTSTRSLRTAPAFRVTFRGSGTTSFASPGDSRLGEIEHFNNLTRTLLTNLVSGGTLRFNENFITMQSNVLGAGGTRTLTATGLNSRGSGTLRNVALRIGDGAAILADGGLTLRDFDPGAIQLDFVRSGGAATLAFATFLTAPSGAGRYLRATDTNGATGGLFTVNVSNPTPSTHGGFAETIGGAVLTGWPTSVPFVWTGGAGSSTWTTVGNWSGGAVPGPADSVFVPDGLTYTPSIPAGLTLRAFVSEHQGAPIPVAGDLTITRNIVVSQGGGLECSGGSAVVLGNPVAPLSIAGRFGCLVRVVSGLATATDTVTVVEESVRIEGTGSFDAGADLVSIAGSLTTIGAGTLRMTSDSADVVVDSDVSFGGGSTAGLLVTGMLFLRGDFTQLGSPSAFAASASHTTVLQSVAPPTVTFANPGSGAAASHFGHLVLDLQSVNSYVVVESDVYADGVLEGFGGPAVFQAALPRLFQSRGADVDGIEFRNVSWRLVDGEAETFLDGVSFNSMSPTVIQMEIVRASGSISMSGPDFPMVPTGAGRYLRVVDSNGIGGAGEDLVVNVSIASPQYHGGFAEAVAPAAITGWPAAPAAATVNAWTGALSNAWSNVGNWSLGRLPVATDSVVIDRAGTYVVNIDVSTTVGWLVVGSLGTATINNVTGAALTINDAGVFLAPSVLNLWGGSVMAGAGGVLIGGTFNWNGGQLASAGITSILSGGTANIATTGGVTLSNRTLSVSGTANIGGAGVANLGTTPAIAVLTGGILQFQSPTTLLAGGGNAFLVNTGGTIRKAAAGGYVRIDWPINQAAGVIDVEAGTLDLRRVASLGGTTIVRPGATLVSLDQTNLTGAMNVEGLGTVSLTSGGAGQHFLLPGSTFSGLGTLEINGANLVRVEGAFDIDSLTLQAATLEFNSADTAFVTRGRYIGGGFLRGTGVLAIRGTFSSTTGNINGTGTFAVRPGGTFTLQSPLRGWNVDVAGTLHWGDWDLSLEQDPVSLRNPRIDVRPGGLFRIAQGTTARQMFANTSNVIATFTGGTIRKTTGTATTLIRAAVVHSGLFDVLSSGPISLQFPCTLVGGTFSGTAVIGCP